MIPEASDRRPRVIFENSDVRVIYAEGEGDLLLMTFADLVSLADGLQFFGAAPAAKAGLPVIGFVAKRGAWYPAASTLQAIDAIEGRLAPFTRRLTYGGSMGGYAALKFSRALGASHVLALCPQWSIDPAECGGTESGYSNFFTQELTGMGVRGDDVSGTAFVFSDLGDAMDAFHCRQISRVAPEVRIINVPMTGHSVTSVFAGTANLLSLFGAVIDDDVPAARRLARQIRTRHPVRLQTLLARAYPRHRRLCMPPLLARASHDPAMLTAAPRLLAEALATLVGQGRRAAALELLDRVRATMTDPVAQLRATLVASRLLGSDLVVRTFHSTRLTYDLAADAGHHAVTSDTSMDLPLSLELHAGGVDLATTAAGAKLVIRPDGEGVLRLWGPTATEPAQAGAFRLGPAVAGAFSLQAGASYLSAEPGGRLVCNRPIASGWEWFRFGLSDETQSEPVREAAVTAARDELPTAEPASVERGGGEHTVSGALHDDILVEELQRSLAMAASPDGSPADVGPDPWAEVALPSLAGWLRQRERQPRTSLVGEEYDFLANASPTDKPTSLAFRCSKALRAATRPRRHLCALAVARNEGIYIVDWLAHHLATGVEDVFLYTNDNTDGSDLLLQALADQGVIRLYKNRVGAGVGPQLKAYAHALQFVPDVLDFEWMALMDLDESLSVEPSTFPTFSHFLKQGDFSGVDCIALSWTMQGPNGARRWRRDAVEERFPRRSGPDRHVKSVFRPGRFSWAHPHFPQDEPASPRRYVTADGEPFRAWPFNEAPSCSRAWSAHYYFKSAEEFLVRRLRNRADVAVSDSFDDSLISEALANLYVQMYLHPELYADNSEPLPQAKAWRERLRSLPGVAAAEQACQDAYLREVALVRDYLAGKARFRTPGSPEAALFDLAFD